MLAEVPRDTLREARERYYRALGYTPKLGARMVDAAVDRGKRILGHFTPPQHGKSYSIAKHVGPYLHVPGTQVWLVGREYEDTVKEYGYLRNDLAEYARIVSGKPWSGWALKNTFDPRGGNMALELRNGSWVKCVSLNKGTDDLRKEQVDVVVFCEASKMDADPLPEMWLRLEKRKGLAFYPSTHRGYGWLWDVQQKSLPVKEGTYAWGPWVDCEGGAIRQRVGGEANPGYDPDYFSVQVSYVEDYGEVLDRRDFTPETIEKARRTLPRPLFAEQFGGQAASYQGLIYEFDPRRHEVDPFPIPEAWPVVVGWDHGAGGGSDPTFITLRSVSPEGVSYYWGEIVDESIQTTAQRAGMLKALLGTRRLAYPIMRGGDAKQIGTELAEVGLPSTHPDATQVMARILRITDRLGDGKIKLLRGKVPRLRQNLLSYEWDDRNPGKPKDGNDHGVESMGYNELAGFVPERAAPPDVPVGEPRAVTQEWAGFREKMRAMEQGRDLLVVERMLDDDPYDMELAGVQFIG